VKQNRILANYEHPLVRETAKRITQGEVTVRGKIEKLFYYVRDDIKFGFPAERDLVSASETIERGMGQCNTKGTLFLALCKALNIPARLHFSLIEKKIQRGNFTSIAYWLLPPSLSHAWLEVEMDGQWYKIDSYINDAPFQHAALIALEQRGWETGYSVATADEAFNEQFNLEEESFVQMDAVTDDHGVWGEPADYYNSPAYRNQPDPIRLWIYRQLIGSINKRVERMRLAFQEEECAKSVQAPIDTSRLKQTLHSSNA